MKNIMTKSTFREIKGSFGRWFAILAIVALGVGFFSGLKVCKEDFVETGNQYVLDQNMYNYELMSTLGLETEDVDYFNHLEGVALAEGSYSTDAIVTYEADEEGPDNERVAKFHTISSNIDRLSLDAGSLPTETDQFLGDSHYFKESDIGKKIKIASSNEKDTRKMFVYKEYELVGLVSSPAYLNFERGSTSLGSGTVSYFIYIPEEGWDSDVFTEIYIDFSDDYYIFSEEYDKNADIMEDRLTEALDKCGERRYDDIIYEAREKLADAEADVADAERELAGHEQDLADARIKLDDAREEYDEGVKSYNEEKDAAYLQLNGALAQGFITQEQYDASKAEADEKFAAAWKELEDGKVKIDDGLKEISDAEAEIAKGRNKINQAKDDLREARNDIDDIEYPTTYVLGRDTNIGYICFENDSKIVDGIARVFPIFFFLVAALVCMTTMTRMIDDQRTQIGVLKALGYSRRQILRKYVFYSGSGAIIGGISGFVIGSHLFPWVIWEVYGIMYGFAEIIFLTNWTLFTISLAAALLCSVGTTIYSCNAELAEVPAQLIRPKAPKAGKRILLERVPFIWNKLKFLIKVSIRNTFRYKKRFFMMVLGISGCTALLITGLGIKDSIANVVSAQYDEIYHVDYTVSFKKDMSKEEQKAFLEETEDVVSDCIFLYTSSVDARTEEHVKSINLVVANKGDDTSKFIDLHNDDGVIPYPSDGKGVINSNLADNLGLSIGDTISVYDTDMRELTVEIAALCDNYVYNYLYIDNKTFEEQWGHPEENSAFVIGPHNEDGEVEDPHSDGAEIMNARNVSSVTITRDFRDRITNMMKSLDYIVILVVVCAGALAFIVLYNLTNINITERIREIATIKVLGFYGNETASYVFRENILLTAISALVGLPLGKALHAFVMSQVKIDMLSFDVHIEPISYLFGIVITFGFSLIVSLVMQFKLAKVSMTESLKSIE